MKNIFGLSDELMAAEIGNVTGDLLVVANKFTALIASKAGPSTSWLVLGIGDFGLKSGEAAKALSRKSRLWWEEIDGSPANFDVANAAPSRKPAGEVTAWIAAAEKLTTKGKGRGIGMSGPDSDFLGCEAGWRCQFSGCGKDLRTHSPTGSASRSSYFAHIIAASPDGPRGDSLLSHQLSADPYNYLLLCDECHRRIDREDPDRFTAPVLRKMRQDSIAEVRRLLDSLRHQEAVPIVLMGAITAQAPHFVQREAEEAMWLRKLRMAPGHVQTFLENSWSLHDPHSTAYWDTLLHSFEAEWPQLRKLLRTDVGTSRAADPLAIFPLHGTSVLILAGRIFGEAAAATVFQFLRERSPTLPGGRWGFDHEQDDPGKDKYFVREVRAPEPEAQEACLLVSLTFKIEEARLPQSIFQQGFKMAAIEVTANGALGQGIISTPKDLDLVSVQLGESIRILQDEWHAKRVHVFIGAPASAVFKLGQKLQARHQATYVCHETAAGPGGSFMPTIEISGDEVRVVGGNKVLRLG